MNRDSEPTQTKIGLGLAAIGRPEYINIRKEIDPGKSETSYRKRTIDLLNYAYAKGIRDFDTAASYGKGEEFLRQWYEKSPHADLRLSSKWGYTYVADWKIGYSGSHEVKEHSLKKLREQWISAKKLLPGLKTYQIHSATFESGVLQNKEVLNELFQIKKMHGIRMGLSVSGTRQSELLEEASKIRVGKSDLFDSFQVTYNILDVSAHDVMCGLLSKGKAIIVKEALANGRLLRNDGYPQYFPLYDMIEKLSSQYEVGSDAIALRFVMDRLKPTVVLSGASSKQQLESNLKANHFELESNEIKSLANFNIDPDLYWFERKQLPWN